MPRSLHVAFSISLLVLINSCGSDHVGGPPFGPALRIVLGGGVTDTVDAHVLPLVVEVRDQSGKPDSRSLVRFESQTVSNPPNPLFDAGVFVCPVPPCPAGLFAASVDSTDAQGRATAGVRLGHKAGKWFVRITAPELGLADSVSYTVMPGAPAGVRALIADTALDLGEKTTVQGRVVDRYENVRTESTTLTPGTAAAVTIEPATSTVTARDVGTQWVFPRFNDFYDSTRIRVLPSGRLLVWSALEKVVRLVDINGRNERTILSNIWSALGANAQFDPTRRRITLQNASDPGGTNGNPDEIIVVDTTGAPRRDLGSALGFDGIMTTRQTADGTLFVVARRSSDASHPDWSLWRVDADNSITFLAYLPDVAPYNGGADISHTGSKVVFAANTATFPPDIYVMDVASGSTKLIDKGFSPRWSPQDDWFAYLTAIDGTGTAIVANTNGTIRISLGSETFSQGFGWSPDGKYVIGHSAEGNELQIVRFADGAQVTIFFRSPTGFHDYSQPDWR